MWGTFNEVMDPWGGISFKLATLWNYTCTSCQRRKHFYPREAPRTRLFAIPHVWEAVAVMCGQVRCRSGHMWSAQRMLTLRPVCFSMSYFTGVMYKLHLPRGPSMARGCQRTKITLTLLITSSFSFKAPFRHRSADPSHQHRLAFQKNRSCCVTKQRDSWKTYCGSQSCS